MFIDNDDLVCDSLKVFFGGSRLNFLIFRSASDGLNSLKYQEIDMVVSDYSLPDMNGIEFLKRVARNHPGITRILMTTIVNDDLKCEFDREGIDRLIEKPLTVASLDTIINDFKKLNSEFER